MFDSPKDGASSGGVASDGGSVSIGTIFSAVATIAWSSPPFGGPETGAPASSVEQKVFSARFSKGLRAKVRSLCFSMYFFLFFVTLRLFFSGFRIRPFFFYS